MRITIRYLLLLILLCATDRLYAKQHYDSFSDLQILSFINGSDSWDNGPVVYLRIIGNNQYGSHDWVKNCKIYGVIEGVGEVSLGTVNDNVNGISGNPINDTNRGHVKYDYFEEGSPGFRWCMHNIGWHVPARAMGRNVYIRFTYDYYHNASNKGNRSKTTLDGNEVGDGRSGFAKAAIKSISKVTPSLSWVYSKGVPTIKATWNGTTDGGLMFINGQSFSSDNNEGIVTNNTFDPNKTQSLSWRNEKTFTYSKWDITQTRTPWWDGTVSIEGLAKPIGLQSIFDPCINKVRLTWNITTGTRSRQFIFRRKSSETSWTKIATLGEADDNWTDNDFLMNMDYVYAVTAAPMGFPEAEFIKYKLYASSTAKTELRNYIINLSSVNLVDNGSGLKEVVVKWNAIANMCDNEKTKLTLVRESSDGATPNKEYPIQNFMTDLEKNVGTLAPCETYRFYLRLDFNGKSFYSNSREIYDADPPEFNSFKSTKGVYSNKVLLTWAVDKPKGVENYKVYRKLLQDPVEKYQLIASKVDNSPQVTYSDEDAIASNYYSYMVVSSATCGGKIITTSIEDNGFVQPYGIVAGRIQYKGGTAVGNVAVRLEKLSADEMIDQPYRSLQFTGTSKATATFSSNHPCIRNDFSFQAFIRGEFTQNIDESIFKIGNEFSINRIEKGSKLQIKAGNAVTSFPFENNRFIQLTVTCNSDSVLVYYDSKKVGGMLANRAVNCENSGSCEFGAVSNGFTGFIDEVRLWTKKLSRDDIQRTYEIYLSGTENDLFAYWRFDENLNSHFYDLAHTDLKYKENHGLIYGAIPSKTIPNEIQLALKGYTSKDGNYLINGIPYGYSGSTYSLSPNYETHQFEPSQQTRHIGGGGPSVINAVDFSDVSSFAVTGQVKFKNTEFPVQGAYLYIDGEIAKTSSGQIIQTDEEGLYKIDVPIGRHQIQVQMNGHTFVENRFPGGPDANATWNFQTDLTNINFTDKTLVKYIGRVAGGRVERDRPVGFGKSENNLGAAVVKLSPVNNRFYLNHPDSLTRVDTIKIGGKYSKTAIAEKEIRIEPNDETGEFVAYLPPINYNVTSASGGDHFITADQLAPINMVATMPLQNEELKDEDGKTVIDRCSYQYKSVFSYIETVPTIIGRQIGMRLPGALGDSIVIVKKLKKGTQNYEEKRLKVAFMEEKEISVTENGQDLVGTGEYELKYLFNHPIFLQNTTYEIEFDVREVYKNNQTGKEYVLPYADGELFITNNLAREIKDTVQLTKNGICTYTFSGGFPSFTKVPGNDDESFLKSMQIELKNSSGKVYPWNEGMKGYLFGCVSEGSDFVTSGPDLISCILRDPPGSGSSASWEKGYTSKGNFSLGIEASQEGEIESTMKCGPEVTVGFGVMSKNKVFNDTKIKNKLEFEESSGTKMEWSTETTETIETSSDPAWIGADADIFMGTGTNITYGMARALNIYLTEGTTFGTKDVKSVSKTVNDTSYVIGSQAAMRIDVGFGTQFVYTQSHIINTLIPNLRSLRDKFFSYSANPKNEVNSNPKKSLYYTDLTPQDPKYGSSNTNSTLWGNQASTKSDEGPSYYYLQGTALVDEIDSVAYFNEAIAKWELNLKMNEEEKVERKKDDLIQNYSFDAGSSFNRSVKSTSTYEYAGSFKFAFTKSFSNETGGEIGGIGAVASFEVAYKTGISLEFGGGAEKTEGFSFSLSDTDENNYMSVDVYKSKGSHGPMFIKRGGRTSCPYEDADVTNYYQPGTKIDAATVQIEKPSMSVNRNIASDIPGGSDAVFMLSLMNETVAGVNASLNLSYDDATNPNGAILMIDGQPLTSEGRVFSVSPTEPLVKTLIVRQARTDVHEFEGIKLILSSNCDSDIRSEQDISVYFAPSSSNINLKVKEDRSIVNMPSGTVLPIEISNLQLDYKNFATVAIQYKSINASIWNTIVTYVHKDRTDISAIIKGAKELSGSQFTHYWDMKELTDGKYEIRAVTSSLNKDGGLIAQNVSLIKTVLKDVTSPKEIGKPQPTNGVFTPADNILITFNEDIDQPMVTRTNLKVQGELNGYTVRENVGLEFEGGADCATTEADVNLANKSFSIELWTKHFPGQKGVIVSHGDQTEAMDIYFDENNYINVNYKGKSGKSVMPINNDGWIHLTFTYDAGTESLSAYVMGQGIADSDRWIIKDAKIGGYTFTGKVRLGGSLVKNANLPNYKGYVNELRMWSKKRTLNDVSTTVFSTLSGLENGLTAYWPLTEGRGALAKDKVLAKNLQLNCTWYIYPKGYAAKFDGVRNMLQFNTGFVATKDNSYTLEFWFRGEPQTNANMFTYSTLKRNANIAQDSILLAMGFDDAGQLAVWANGQKYPCGTNSPLDNQWHHIAFVLNRASNGYLYLDGELRMSMNHTLFPPLMDGTGFLGAQGYKRNALNGELLTGETGLNLFKGAIDEYRGWLSAITQNQLEIDINSRMRGTETGLAAYYPFDEYRNLVGTIEVQPVFKDLMKNKIYANAGDLIIKGTDYSTNSAAPIKDVRPKEDVNFNYTVSDRQIQIDVIEPIERIEATVLEFTVDNVPDIYSNLQTSPVKWTAYVQMNTMKWKENQITKEISPSESVTFTVDIQNTSGNKQNFVINNIPEWLTPSISSGILQPLETKTINFTISTSLNIGKYEEILYLQGGSNITSPLKVNVKVKGEKPSWSVDPSQFDYSMNVIGQLRIDGVLTTDTEDIIGAFVNDQCVGLASPEYLPAQDRYVIFLSIYNNNLNNQKIEYRVWDASTGRIYPTVNPKDMSFMSDASFGTIETPIPFNALDEVQLDLNLNKGWTWVSTNVLDSKLAATQEMFDPVKNSVDQIKSINASLIYNNSQWMGDLDDNGGFKVGYALKVKMNALSAIKLIGKEVVSKNTSITLNKGWTWLGYTPSLVAPINTALATLPAEDGDLIKSQKGFAMYYLANGGWIGSLKYLRPGEGYMINMKNGKNFTYPTIKSTSVSKVRSKATKSTDQFTEYWNSVVSSRYETSMTICASVKDNLQTLDFEKCRVMAFVGNECRGIGEYDNGLFFVIVNATNKENVSFKLANSNNQQISEIQETVTYSNDAALGTPATPYTLTVKSPVGLDELSQGIAIYPTPVKDWLNIRANDTQINRISIYDTVGRLIYHVKENVPTRINLEQIEKGNYVILINTDSGEVRKIFIKY